jgi:hypothetical protein
MPLRHFGPKARGEIVTLSVEANGVRIVPEINPASEGRDS